MNADLEDLHPSLRANMLKNEEYLRTQDQRTIDFYIENGVDAKYIPPRKAVLPHPAG